MKISRLLWIDPNIKWNLLIKAKLLRKNAYEAGHYLVCTSSNPHLLFEIIRGNELNERYNKNTLLALCISKEQALERVTVIVDQIYNKQMITYNQLLEK